MADSQSSSPMPEDASPEASSPRTHADRKLSDHSDTDYYADNANATGFRAIVRFCVKLGFVLLALAVGFTLYARIFIGGEDNPHYLRFTTPAKPSLVIGSSRCGENVRPAVFNESDLDMERPLFNYCFTVAHSPYGPLYLRSIKRKVDPSATNGLYILEVNPWTVMRKKSNTADSPGRFIEQQLEVAQTRFVNSFNPNFEFLLQMYDEPFYKAAWDDMRGLFGEHPGHKAVLQRDGWLQVNVSMDPEAVAERAQHEYDKFAERVDEHTISATRLGFLEKTITFLQRHGRVYLVRMPIEKDIYGLEQEFSPNFDSLMTHMAGQTGATYINMVNEREPYRFIDGNHIYRDDSKAYTQALLRRIKKIEGDDGTLADQR